MLYFNTNVGATLIGFPRTRGDVPPLMSAPGEGPKFSPLAWGCTGIIGSQKEELFNVNHYFPWTTTKIPVCPGERM